MGYKNVYTKVAVLIAPTTHTTYKYTYRKLSQAKTAEGIHAPHPTPEKQQQQQQQNNNGTNKDDVQIPFSLVPDCFMAKSDYGTVHKNSML